MRKPLTTLLVLSVLLVSCWDFNRRPPTSPLPPGKVLGYKPVYSSDPALIKVQSMSPQPVQSPGKIYVKGNLIFQSDFGNCFHIIDNSNPASPVRIGFIRVLGNSEISIKGNYIYANSFFDIVVIDASDWQNATEIKRIPNAFSAIGNHYGNFLPLPEHAVRFECSPGVFVDKVQTGWVKDSISNYSCYYP